MIPGVRSPHPHHVLDRHGAFAAPASGLDSGDRHLPQHARLDHVRRAPTISSFHGSPAGSAPPGTSLPCQNGGRLVPGHDPRHLYFIFNPDGIAPLPIAGAGVPGFRRSNTRRCRIWPVSSSASCWPTVDEFVGRTAGCASCSASSASPQPSASLSSARIVPYAVIHDGLLMPLFGCIILGLAGRQSPAPGRPSALAPSSSSARPVTASTCSTSTSGT
jgi:hypothetical protein